MSQLAHRRYSLFDQSQGDLRAKSGAYVHVLPPGGTVVSVAYTTVTILGVLVTYTDFTLQAGHGFSTGQRFIIGTDTGTFGQILSAQSTNVLRAQGSYSAVAGDLLVNLGSDSGATSPNWDDSTIPIYLTSDGSGSAESPSQVTTSEEGEYQYWLAYSPVWEVARTTDGVVLDIIQGGMTAPKWILNWDGRTSVTAENPSTGTDASSSVGAFANGSPSQTGGVLYAFGANYPAPYTGDAMVSATGAAAKLHFGTVGQTRGYLDTSGNFHLKSVNNVRYIHMYATGGSGTSASPWTGWESGVVEGVVNYFPAGYYSCSTLSVPITLSNTPSKTALLGAGSGSTFITITSGAGQVRVYGSGSGTRVLDGVRVEGLTIFAGANNTSSGLLSFENGDQGCYVHDIRVDPTTTYSASVGFQFLNCENMRIGSVVCRGWSDTNGAAGNVGIAYKFYTDDGIQRGNIVIDYLHGTRCTTGIKMSTSGGSFDNIRFNLAKLVNANTVNGTLAVDLDSNVEQISFGDLHVEVFNNGLDASAVENLVIENGIFSQCHNEANNAGAAITITNGDGGYIFTRLNACYNGVVLAGTTTRYFYQYTASGSITGTLYTDSSSGLNTRLSGQTFLSPVTFGGNLTMDSFFSLGATSGPLTIASGVITVTKNNHSVDTEAAAVSDDLDTISGGTDGQILVIRATNDARTVVAKDGTGNLLLAGDFSLDNSMDTLMLIKAGSNWIELGRSDNGA